MKKWICLLAVLMLLPVFPVIAESAPAGTSSAIVPLIRDDANLLTDAEEAALAEVMAPICAYGTPVFWTTNASGSHRTKAENYYFKTLGHASGALFVIDMSARELTLLTDGEIYRTVNSADAATIVDNVYRLASRGDYAGCAKEVFSQVEKLLQGEQIARPMKLISNILLALTLSLMLMYFFLSRRYENRPKTGKVRAALPVTAGAAAAFTASLTAGRAIMTKQHKVSLSSGSGGHGGGGRGGGFSGGGGGGFSGGGGSHGF